jgi:HEAT repeat protein
MRTRAAVWATFAAAMLTWCNTTWAQAGASPDVNSLVKQLSSSDAEARNKAIDDLASFGTQADVAVPALVQALSGADVQLQWRAARTLGAIGGGAKAAVPALQKALKSNETAVRGWSAYALGQIGEASRPAVTDVAALLADPDRDVRRSAVSALIAIRPAPELMIQFMRKAIEDNDIDPSVTVPALHALGGAGEKGIAALIEALNNEKARYWACIALGASGPKAKAAVPALAKLLSHQEPEIRMQAAIALGEIGPDSKTAATQLIKALSDEQNSVRYAAAFAIGQIGAAEATPELKKQLASQDSFLRMISAWALAKINPNDKAAVDEAVKLLVASLKDENPRVRAAAARGLHELKAPPEVIVPLFTDMLKDKDPVVRGNVIDALSTLDEKIMPRLSTGLENKDVQSIAVGIIRRLGPKAKALVPSLVKELSDPDPNHRQEVAFALAAMGPDAVEAVPALAKALEDSEASVRNTACYALGKIGPAAKSAIPALQRSARSSDDKFLKVASVWALLRIEPANQPLRILAVPLLVTAFTESDRELVKVEVLSALGDIGPAAAPAIPLLEKAAKEDSSADVREAATEAIKKIKAK